MGGPPPPLKGGVTPDPRDLPDALDLQNFPDLLDLPDLLDRGVSGAGSGLPPHARPTFRMT